MGIFSFLFAGPAPTVPAPHKNLNRFYPVCNSIPSDYTVIDLETSGLDACTSEILEIGAIKFRNHKEISRYHTYIKPEGKISPSASAVNHITWMKVCDAPTIEQVRTDFFSFITDEILVGHNIGFDIKFIQTRFEISLKNKCFDTLYWCKIALPDLSNYKLDSLRTLLHLGGSAHSALGDCTATQKLLVYISNSNAAKEEMKEQADYEQKMAEHAAELQRQHDEYMSKKAELRKKSPSTKELNAISKQMCGTVAEYQDAIINILANNGCSVDEIRKDKYLCGTECKPVKYKDQVFFSVKLTGNLKYVVLAVSPEKINNCDFIYTPSSMNEGVDSTRFFVHSPSDLKLIKSFVLQSFYSAVENYERNHKKNMGILNL